MDEIRRPAVRPTRTRVHAVAVILAGGLIMALGAATWALGPSHRGAPVTGAAPASLDDGAQTGPFGSSTTDANIAFWQARLRTDARNYIAATLLGSTWSQKARETGDVADYLRAEQALRAALQVNPGYDRAKAALAGVLFSEHEFGRALALADQVATADPGPTQAFATAADARLELGQVVQAADAYHYLEQQAAPPPVHSRMARLAFLQGDQAQALAWARRAVDEAAANGAAGETLAWYRFQLGELEFTGGQLAQADAAYQAALGAFPGYYLATAGLAKVAAARGDLPRAERLYQHAVDVLPRPDLVAALGDVQAARGEATLAAHQYATVEFIGKLAAINRQVYNRQLALFDADHDRNLAEALRLAEAELQTRQDVYGWDAASWTAYKAGHHARAAQAATRALRLGTHDPKLLYHAGMAALGVGDRVRARELLAEALAINPTFDLLQAPVARNALAEASR